MIKPDDSDAPNGKGTPAPGSDKPVPWWRRTRNQVLAGVGTVVTGVVAGVIISVVSVRLPAPVHAQPTSTSVTARGQRAVRRRPRHQLASHAKDSWKRLRGRHGIHAARPGLQGRHGIGVRQPPQQLAPLGWNGDPDSWAVRNHGIPQSGNYITLTVQARPGHTVIILRFVSRSSAGQRRQKEQPRTFPGDVRLTPSFFDVNLDKPGLQAMPVTGRTRHGRRYRPFRCHTR